MLILDNDSAAQKSADELFVRYVAYRDKGDLRRDPKAQQTGVGAARSEWLWLFRVATHHALGLMDDAAIPGGDQITVAARRPLPSVGELRRLDELNANARVLVDLDGLGKDEVIEVLGRLPARWEPPRGVDGEPPHPSRLRLLAESEAPEIVAHTNTCAVCASAQQQSFQWASAFAARIGPEDIARMTATVTAARARPPKHRARQAVIVTVSLLAVCALALSVARPKTPRKGEAPYAGMKGASLVKASGIQISLRRDDDVKSLGPETPIHTGDRLLFRVRAERPRFLELRVRQEQGKKADSASTQERPTETTSDVRIFPVGVEQALLVNPRQAIDRDFLVTATEGTVLVVASFADHPFPVDSPPGPDVEVVPVRIPLATVDANNALEAAGQRPAPAQTPGKTQSPP